MSEENIWDPEHKYENESSPFQVKEGVLYEFRPARAMESLLDDSRGGDERLVILAGLTAWMIAPSGTFKAEARSVRPLSATEFIYQAMMIRATEDLDEVFYSARRYQALFKDWSNSKLLSQDPLLNHNFSLFFALGGFEAVMNHASLPEFQTHLKNQTVPVRYVCDVVDALISARKAGEKPTKDDLWKRASEAARRHYGHSANDAAVIPSKVSPKPIVPGHSPSNIRKHWDDMAPATPLLYAASEIDNGEFILKVLRDNSYHPYNPTHWDHAHPGFHWAGPWIKRADEIAEKLKAVGLIMAWPPVNVFRTP